ncbi:MAG: hypothetical protein MK212_21770, partial [Saprospiraceae bacterium]|nr:hypothetical protein [Saprospiraceae bacterium]
DAEVIDAIETIVERGLLDVPKYADLTISEAAALTRLTMNYGFTLSDALVSGNLTSFQQVMVNLLDNAYTKLPIHTESSILFRLEFREASEIAAWSEGVKLDYPNFISTAKSTESSYIDGGSFNNVLFKVNNDNSSIIDIEDFSIYNGDFNNEMEALVLRGKKLEIKSIVQENHPDLEDWLLNDQMNPSGSATITTIIVDIID